MLEADLGGQPKRSKGFENRYNVNMGIGSDEPTKGRLYVCMGLYGV